MLFRRRIIPAFCGSWFVVFRERVLEAALIGVAQWVEHQAVNLTVTGSTPVDATKLAENQPDPGRDCVHHEAGGQRLFGSIGCCRMSLQKY